MSLYDRLNFTRPTRKLKVPIWERIDLTRPPKSRCPYCRSLIQKDWQFCGDCGVSLRQKNDDFRHCIWADLSGISLASENSENKEVITNIIMDAFSKVFGAFRSVQVFLTSDPPDPNKWVTNFTHVYICVDQQPVNYLGIASFKLGMVTEGAIVRLDQIFNASYRASLDANRLSNLIANTIAHEIGHTLGLDHSALQTDVMHDGLDYTIHSMMPPSFHAEQINLMNHAIRKYKSLKGL